MYNYHIKPKAPLLFRDGKPFGTDDNHADTLLFPQPSTIAGAIKTAWADSKEKDYSNTNDIESIKKKTFFGPLLTSTIGNKTQVLFPAPADSLCLTDKANNKPNNTIYRLTPKAIKAGEGTDIETKLTPVFPLEKDLEKLKGKPAKDAPKFWNQEKMEAWLLDDKSDQLPAADQGILNLPIETRTHVSINPSTKTAHSGHLFQTSGLDFSKQRAISDEDKKQWGWQQQEFGLACQFQEDFEGGYRTIGGEARLGQIEKSDKLIPDCPTELSKAINQSKGFRLILATPAIFKQGYIPQFIDKDTMQGKHNGMTLKLHAVSNPRWQAGTSWDMASAESKNGKGMRSLKRLAPAGSVYWFELIEPQNMPVESFWLTSISDERENDGYGFTTIGVWHIPENLKNANEKDNA